MPHRLSVAVNTKLSTADVSHPMHRSPISGRQPTPPPEAVAVQPKLDNWPRTAHTLAALPPSSRLHYSSIIRYVNACLIDLGLQTRISLKQPTTSMVVTTNVTPYRRASIRSRNAKEGDSVSPSFGTNSRPKCPPHIMLRRLLRRSITTEPAMQRSGLTSPSFRRQSATNALLAL